MKTRSDYWINLVSITLASGVSINTMETRSSIIFNNSLERQSYWGQALTTRNLGETVSAQLSPTVVHRNKTETVLDANITYTTGAGGRVKSTKRTTV